MRKYKTQQEFRKKEESPEDDNDELDIYMDQEETSPMQNNQCQTTDLLAPLVEEKISFIDQEDKNDKPLPFIKGEMSLEHDMKFGWRPEADKDIPPIPLCFGLVYYKLEQFNYQEVCYIGNRVKNSYKLHEQFANKQIKLPCYGSIDEQDIPSYSFQFPKLYKVKNFRYEEAFQQFQSQVEDEHTYYDQKLNFTEENQTTDLNKT